MNLKEEFGAEWYSALEPFLLSETFAEIGRKVLPKKFSSTVVYPKREDIFKAFRLTPLSKVKVVILGQDPYPDGSAVGLAFSNRDYLKISPSLQNIFKEIETDIYGGFILDQHPDLTRWAEQGVLLLNTALTVEENKPGSHAIYWDSFTKTVLRTLSEQECAIVYMLWGNHAKSYLNCIDRETNFILTSAHPSPLSANRAGWFGCKHFSKCNEVLHQVAIAKELDPETYKIKW